MSAAGCLYNCLREAKLDQHYPRLWDMQVTSLESLVNLSMQDYDSCGVTSVQDKHRLFELIQIVKDVQQRSGKHCSKGCHRHHTQRSSPQRLPQQIPQMVMNSSLNSPERRSEGYTLIFDSVRKRLASKDKNMQTGHALTGFTVVDIPSGQFLQKQLQSMNSPLHSLQIPGSVVVKPQALGEQSPVDTPKKKQFENTVISASPSKRSAQSSLSSDSAPESAKFSSGPHITSSPHGMSKLEETYLQYLTPNTQSGSPGPSFGPPKPREAFTEKIHHGNGYDYGLPRKSTPKKFLNLRNRQEDRIKVCVRKRPLNRKETRNGEEKIVNAIDEKTVLVDESKTAIDLTDFIHQHEFVFDEVFDENCSNQDVYESTAGPLVDCVFEGGSAVCFAYGQTGAGKTYTMMGKKSVPGLYVMAADHIFQRIQEFEEKGVELRVWVSYVEIYLNQLFDLLDRRKRVHVREDGRRNVLIRGLSKSVVKNVTALLGVIEAGNSLRSTGTTGVNPDSSRSHAILQLEVRDKHDRRQGKMSFIDLAGSERLCEVTDFSNKQNRLEGAEINQSLLALKECIRSIDQATKHTPFRQSKLTHILKDSFVGNSKTCMIANISPGKSACDHTLNTLRYADRVKEIKRSGSKDRLDDVEKSMADSRSRSQSSNANTKASSPISSTPSVFHPSSIPLSSTPKKLTPQRSRQHGSPKKQISQSPMYETPIRGHKMKRKTADMKTTPELSSSSNSQRNKTGRDGKPVRIVREPISVSQDKNNSKNERGDGVTLIQTAALSYETLEKNRNIYNIRQQPAAYQSNVTAHQVQQSSDKSSYFHQSLSHDKLNEAPSTENSSNAEHQSEIVTHLDDIMARAKAAIDKSQIREEDKYSNHVRDGNNRLLPMQAWDQMTTSDGHGTPELSTVAMWRKYNEPIPPVNLHRYLYNEHIPGSPPLLSQPTSTNSSPKSPENRRPKLSPLLPDKNFNFLHFSRNHGSPTSRAKISASTEELEKGTQQVINSSHDSNGRGDHSETSLLDAKRKLFRENETTEPSSPKSKTVVSAKDTAALSLEGKNQLKEPVLGQQTPGVPPGIQKESFGAHREWHPKSALAQKIQSLPSPDDFLKSLAEIRLQKKTQREPSQRNRDSDSDSTGDKMSPRSPPSSSYQGDQKENTPAVGKHEPLHVYSGKGNDLRTFPELLGSPSNSRRSGAFQPYNNLPPGKLSQVSQGNTDIRQDNEDLVNNRESDQEREILRSVKTLAISEAATVSIPSASADLEHISDVANGGEAQTLGQLNSTDGLADPKKLITEAISFIEEDDEKTMDLKNTTDSDTGHLLPTGENAQSDPDMIAPGNNEDRADAAIDIFSESSKTTTSSSSLSSSGLDSSPGRVSSGDHAPFSMKHSNEDDSSNILKLPPPPVFVPVNSTTNGHTAFVNPPVRIERLGVGGIPGTTFSPIHPSPSSTSSKLVTVPAVITKTILDDNISDGSLIDVASGGKVGDKEGSFDQEEVNGLNRPALTRGDSAQERAQNLLITSHEEQLAEMTVLCKEEMRLLRRVKSGDLTFPVYVKKLKSVLSSKCRCIETLSGQLAELSAYTFESPHLQLDST